MRGLKLPILDLIPATTCKEQFPHDYCDPSKHLSVIYYDEYEFYKNETYIPMAVYDSKTS